MEHPNIHHIFFFPSNESTVLGACVRVFTSKMDWTQKKLINFQRQKVCTLGYSLTSTILLLTLYYHICISLTHLLWTITCEAPICLGQQPVFTDFYMNSKCRLDFKIRPWKLFQDFITILSVYVDGWKVSCRIYQSR